MSHNNDLLRASQREPVARIVYGALAVSAVVIALGALIGVSLYGNQF